MNRRDKLPHLRRGFWIRPPSPAACLPRVPIKEYVAYNVCASIRDASYTGTAQPDALPQALVVEPIMPGSPLKNHPLSRSTQNCSASGFSEKPDVHAAVRLDFGSVLNHFRFAGTEAIRAGRSATRLGIPRVRGAYERRCASGTDCFTRRSPMAHGWRHKAASPIPKRFAPQLRACGKNPTK